MEYSLHGTFVVLDDGSACRRRVANGMNSREIQRFLVAVRSHLARGRRRAVLARVICGACLLAVFWAIAWRLTGYAVPPSGFIVISALAAMTVGAWIAMGRRNLRHGAIVADREFALKDGLISWLEFHEANRTGEIYQLGERQMERRIAALDVKQIPVSSNRRTYAMAALFGTIAGFLALLPHSDAVRKRLAQEAMTSERSAEIEKQMDVAIEEIVRNMTDGEKQWLKPESLRAWAKQLQSTKDARENEVQLARIEQEISKAMLGLEARQDEAVLKLAAEELAKSPGIEARQLAKKLESKQFKKAAEGLNDIKPAIRQGMNQHDRANLQKNAAATSDVAKRMADGARKREFGNPQGDHARNDGTGKGRQDQMQGLKESLEEFEVQANQLARSLEKNEKEEVNQARVLGKTMDGLGERLEMLGARHQAREQLDALRRGLADARQFAQGKSENLGLAAAATESSRSASSAPGSGKDPSRREQRDEHKENDSYVELKGKANLDGPSSHSVESAASGAGVAGRSHVEKQRDFKRQLESLVRRDDIPQSLKLGVREYFERVHDVPPAK